MKTKFYYDTEFHERGPEYPIEFISIGIVREQDDDYYYAVSNEFDVDAVREHEWLRDNVWPMLPRTATDELNTDHEVVKSRATIATEVLNFLTSGEQPELWAWYSAYDHVVLAQLFGTMAQLPQPLPKRTRDLADLHDYLGGPELPEQQTYEHHALHDARHDKAIDAHMQRLMTQTDRGLFIPAAAGS